MTEVQLFALCALTLGFLTVHLLCSLRRLDVRRWKKLAEQRSRERDEERAREIELRTKIEQASRHWHATAVALSNENKALAATLDSAQRRAAVKVEAAGYADSARKLASHPLAHRRDELKHREMPAASSMEAIGAAFLQSLGKYAAADYRKNEPTSAGGLVLATMLQDDGGYEIRAPFLPPCWSYDESGKAKGPSA